MRDYSVQVTYRVGRATETRGWTVPASSETEAKSKGAAAQRDHHPGITITRVTAEPL